MKNPNIPRQVKDLTGRVFERLTVIEFAYCKTTGSKCKPRRGSYWKCECVCGTVKIIARLDLVTANTKSCGCLKMETPTKHGMARTPEYMAWQDIHQRCLNPRVANFGDYGGRGISVCGGLADFSVFYNIVGARPRGHSIDRADNAGNYSCGNCEECTTNQWPVNIRWATRAMQSRNTRRNHLLTFNGRTLCVTDWATQIGIDVGTFRTRVRKWGIEKAINTPILTPRQCGLRASISLDQLMTCDGA